MTRKRAPLAHYLAQQERARLVQVEARTKARAVARQVADGVAETTQLAEDRGAAYVRPIVRPGERDKPVKKMAGLDWLATRKPPRISAAMKAVGERYGRLWRRAAGEVSIRSGIDDSVGGGGDPILAAHKAANDSVEAREALDELRGRIGNQYHLVKVLDDICGRELTPREAAKDGHDAVRIECLLTVALDLMCSPGRRDQAAA